MPRLLIDALPHNRAAAPDGVALTSMAHPRPVWYKRPWHWLRFHLFPPKLNPAAVEFKDCFFSSNGRYAIMTTPINVDPAALQRVRDFTNVLTGTGAPHQQSVASDLKTLLTFIDGSVPQLVSERDTAIANSLHNIGARDNLRDALRYVRDQLRADKVDTGFVTAYINETLDEASAEVVAASTAAADPANALGIVTGAAAGVTAVSDPIAVAEHQTISGNEATDDGASAEPAPGEGAAAEEAETKN